MRRPTRKYTVIAFTAILWVPYILNRMREMGIVAAVCKPAPDSEPQSKWAQRAARAHQNAIENLVVFAPLVLLVGATGASTSTTTTACMVYFFARVAHYVMYTAGVPVVRTLLFVAGVGAQLTLAATLLRIL